MKTITLLSLIAASVLFTACGEDSKKAAAEATAKTVEVAKTTTQDVKQAAAEATQKTAKVAKETTEDVKAAATKLAEATKEKAEQLAQRAKEQAEQAAQKATEAADALKERAVKTTQAAKKMATEALSDNGAGKAAFAKCAGCHGADGKTKALGKSEIIAGQSAADIEKKITEYKAGTRNVAGMGMLMKGQVASLSDADIKAVSAYISSM